MFTRRSKPEPTPQPAAFTVMWTPEPLPVGERMPTDTLASLAAAARNRDPWSGNRDTDRAWRA